MPEGQQTKSLRARTAICPLERTGVLTLGVVGNMSVRSSGQMPARADSHFAPWAATSETLRLSEHMRARAGRQACCLKWLSQPHSSPSSIHFSCTQKGLPRLPINNIKSHLIYHHISTIPQHIYHTCESLMP